MRLSNVRSFFSSLPNFQSVSAFKNSFLTGYLLFSKYLESIFKHASKYIDISSLYQVRIEIIIYVYFGKIMTKKSC